ncbi:NUDIX domain-containing protein [Microbacterium sp. NPDC019599]|uniref:NUDIX hydrolase n=1 Tax=Microbacterium sp. NPDC019599 TaxID=3154690 RepID=UPI003407B425
MTEPTPPPGASPADRAVRALADVVGESRPRVPGDGTDPGIPVAATVVVLRDGPRGPEALLIERPDRGSFAGAWVFPGGKLDDADRAPGGEEEDAARRAGVREAWEETGLELDPGILQTISCWDPPPGLPLRIRTWFFAVEADAAELVLSPGEAVAAEWVRPEDLLARHARGEVTLYPPTWVTLHSIAGQPDVETVLGMLRLAGFRRFETVARRGASGPLLLWQEDAEYEAEVGDEAGPTRPEAPGDASVLPGGGVGTLTAAARHRLELGSLPWVYTRSG